MPKPKTKLTYTQTVGRYEVTGEYEAVPLDDGSVGMTSKDWERLELEAAIKIFSQPELVNGDELRFARKAMSLLQPALAEMLDVSVGTLSRWETGAEPIQRQTQLAVLLFLEHMLRSGSPIAPSNDTQTLRRIA
jgi:DNA-binding transcriptional regulator YiaG